MKRNERDGKTTVEIFQGKDGFWYVRTKARNRQTGTVSEGYTRKASAVRAAGRWFPGIPLVIVKAALVLALGLFAAPATAGPIVLDGSSARYAWTSPAAGSGAFWANPSYDRNGLANVGYFLGNVAGSDVPAFYANSPGGLFPYLGSGGTTFAFDVPAQGLETSYLQGVTGWPDSEFGVFSLGNPGTLLALNHTWDPKGLTWTTPISGPFGFYLTSQAGTWRSTDLDGGRSHFALFQGPDAWYLGIEDATWATARTSDWDYNDFIVRLDEPTPVPEAGTGLLALSGVFLAALKRKWKS